TPGELWKERYNGKIKLLLTHTLLQVRALNPELFASGTYVPLKVKGKYASHIFAFARRKGKKWMVIAVPLHLAKLVSGENAVPDWKDTRIVLPAEIPLKWLNLLTGEDGELDDHVLSATEIFARFPVGLVEFEHLGNERAAGVLLHITSLPSSYGIGDFGPEARNFVDFLSRSGQKYWQLLPLNPISADQAFSPYSSISSMAGNTLLVSPDLLVRDGLLEEKYVMKQRLSFKGRVDFEIAAKLKEKMLNKAYMKFNSLPGSSWDHDFTVFCKKEASWLDDFALYVVLREEQGNIPWFEWQKEFRFREAEALRRFADAHQEALRFVKWKQFIFFRQWADLKGYATTNGICFYGDLPFYVSHDSVDVWSDREFFSLDKDGQIIGVAGVPPDYFNAEGQLWGMPVYRWDKLKEDDWYAWWLRRIGKNLELYDLLRLDHFRAFADYWEVPAGGVNAKNGKWKTGPGDLFFTHLGIEFPDLPFIAEDLGKITPGVSLLRDEFELAGMKVLQFAFGKDIGTSDHIPHRFTSDNFVVYTGTHDNNTAIGWYYNEAGKLGRKHLEQYTGRSVSGKNVHRVLAQLAYASVAKIVILPMQDVLGLDEKARMNIPASAKGNWKWGMDGQPGRAAEKWLRSLVRLYGRV
ncbi:MAG TPA: 4-alpha-glucanotransferase, partial [Pedobacter sp.]